MLKGYKIVKTDDLTQKAEKALKDCIQSAPFVQIASLEREEDKGDLRVDFTIRMNTPDGEKIIYAEPKNTGRHDIRER